MYEFPAPVSSRALVLIPLILIKTTGYTTLFCHIDGLSSIFQTFEDFDRCHKLTVMLLVTFLTCHFAATIFIFVGVGAVEAQPLPKQNRPSVSQINNISAVKGLMVCHSTCKMVYVCHSFLACFTRNGGLSLFLSSRRFLSSC